MPKIKTSSIANENGLEMTNLNFNQGSMLNDFMNNSSD